MKIRDTAQRGSRRNQRSADSLVRESEALADQRADRLSALRKNRRGLRRFWAILIGWKPLHWLRPCRAARIPHSALRIPHSPTERGILLVDCMVYIALWSVVVGLAFASFYRCWDQTRHLSRNTSDIVRALQAGERWREDVQQAMGELALIESGEAQELRIPQQAGEVAYLFKEGTVFRRAGEKSRWARLLADVKESSMQKDPRTHVTAWRWEIELKTTQKVVRLRPLFTFQAVPPTARKP